MATEISNAPDLYKFCEIIGGKRIRLPSMSIAQDQIKGHIMISILNHLNANKNGYLLSNVDVRFDTENIFVPDLSVILKEHKNILDDNHYIDGAPDMIVEVLSKLTRKNDLGIKKNIYERNGVREYWIVDSWCNCIDVYLLCNGKYFLDDEYVLFDEKDLEVFTDEEKTAIKHEVPVAILDGLKIPLEFIFSWNY